MDCKTLWDVFDSFNLSFFTGVPDSTFKDWMVFLDQEHGNQLTNIIASNECEAIAIATGFHLASGKIGVVYMQNAGEGKTVNPLTSLCDPEVYSVPILLMIGWRGKPGEKDEPQHAKMGKITLSLLDLLEIPHKILTKNPLESQEIISTLLDIANEEKKPVALIVPRGVIEDSSYSQKLLKKYPLSREEAIKIIMNHLIGDEIIISTTGKTSRELFEYRVSNNETPRDFYTVGGMGCAPAIGLGAAMQDPSRQFVILDGDGALLMQLGSLATIGHYRPSNFYHILFDNEGHDSTGGQPTVSKSVNFMDIAHSCGYENVKQVFTKDELIDSLKKMKSTSGPFFLSIKTDQGSRADLGRPTTKPVDNKIAFMKQFQR